MAILHDTSRNAGGGCDVHTFPVVSSGSSVHPSYRSQFSPMAIEDGMLAHWYLLLGQFSVTFECRPGAQHANAYEMSRQCG